MKEQCSARKCSSRTWRILLFSLAVLLAHTSAVFAQNTVKGTVTDAAGNPLPGVNVVVKGTTNGTMSMTDGKYSIQIPPPPVP